MRTRRFVVYLISEALVVAIAMSSFRWVEPRLLAGALAGSAFIAMGAWIFGAGLRQPTLRRTMSFITGTVFLFAVAIPMIAARFWKPDVPFSELQIWGLSGPEFHALSTGVYQVMMVATAFDAIRAQWMKKRISK